MYFPVPSSSKWIKFFLGWGVLTLGILYFDSRPLFLESEESKTAELKPVYNRILFRPGIKQDTWFMDQSHDGPSPAPGHWDKIAMVVNKLNREVSFYQLNPVGSGDPLDSSQKIDFRAKCFMCHSNGPRAIRPNYLSETAKLKLWDRLRIQVWNLRIKTYGKLQSIDHSAKFRFQEPELNEELKVATCIKCHKESGFIARGVLTRQNFMSIRFMIEKGYMPPPGFTLPSTERLEIIKFSNGL